MAKMKCPGCGKAGNTLRADKKAKTFVSCSRFHKFELRYKEGGNPGSEREIVCVSSTDKGCNVGDKFDVPDDADF